MEERPTDLGTQLPFKSNLPSVHMTFGLHGWRRFSGDKSCHRFYITSLAALEGERLCYEQGGGSTSAAKRAFRTLDRLNPIASSADAA